MWKTIGKWIRDRIDVDVDLDLGDGAVAVAVTVRFNDAVLLAERFEWPLPSSGKATKLTGRAARRRRLAPEGV